MTTGVRRTSLAIAHLQQLMSISGRGADVGRPAAHRSGLGPAARRCALRGFVAGGDRVF